MEENSQQLPCINSSNECVNQLTDRAIASSNQLQKLAERITIIDERLAVTEERIEYSNKRQWTNYISTNPVDIIQNIFGGGGVQRDRIAIADLEIKTTDLLAARAELERQQEEEKLEISDRVTELLLDYEAATRRHELLISQLETLNQQREVTRIAYKLGRGETSQILGMEARRDRLGEQIVGVESLKDEVVRELLQVIDCEIEENLLNF
jgi:outer membrane protein TolC